MDTKEINLSAADTPQKDCKILKCPECYNIPEIIENYEGYYKFKCRNNHSSSIELKELLKKCSTSEIYYKCSYGNETNSQDKYILFNFCFKCKKIVCSKINCQKAHENECSYVPENFIPCHNLNSLCYDHGQKLFFYCPKCDINVCEKCEGHEEHNIKFMNQMKIDSKEMKLYNYKIEFTKHYLNYIENQINNFKKEWREDFERNMKYFEETTKYFLDKNKMQVELIETILNTYKIKGNVCIENYKNIQTFCKIPELKFNLPSYNVNEKRKYIYDFSYNYLIEERDYKEEEKKCEKEKWDKEEIKSFRIEKVSKETVSKVLEQLNNLFEINKVEKEEKIIKAIEYVLNDYLSKNSIYSDDIYWYKRILNNIVWEIINYLPNL